MVMLFVSGLFALVALTRIGIRFFWMTSERPAPLLRTIEYLPVALLIVFSVLLTVRAEVVMKFAKQNVAGASFSAGLYPGRVVGQASVVTHQCLSS